MARRSKSVVALMVCSFVLASCAGRTPNPVSAHSPRDDQLKCSDINQEIVQANSRMVTLAEEASSITTQNIVLGVVSFLIFLPLAFAMDFKDAPQTEMHGHDQRNHTLQNIASGMNCETMHAYTVKEAIEIADGKAPSAADGENEDGTSLANADSAPSAHGMKPAPTADHSVANYSAQARPMTAVAARDGNTSPVAPVARSSPPKGLNGPPTLKDLMGMFLRGEVSREEYLELRRGMAPG